MNEVRTAPSRSSEWPTWLFVLGLLLTLVPLAGHASPGGWRSYRSVDEIPLKNFHALAYREDPLDFPPCQPSADVDCPVVPGLWIGTPEGLFYTNGRSEESFADRLPARHVRALMVGRDGRLWIGTENGLTWLDDKRRPESPGGHD